MTANWIAGIGLGVLLLIVWMNRTRWQRESVAWVFVLAVLLWFVGLAWELRP